MTAEEGRYLVSNCMLTPTHPIFAQTIRPAGHRANQWKAIVAARANGRLCHVFKSHEAAQAHFAALARLTFDPARN